MRAKKERERRDPNAPRRGPAKPVIKKTWNLHSQSLGRGDKVCTCSDCFAKAQALVEEELG